MRLVRARELCRARPEADVGLRPTAFADPPTAATPSPLVRNITAACHRRYVQLTDAPDRSRLRLLESWPRFAAAFGEQKRPMPGPQ